MYSIIRRKLYTQVAFNPVCNAVSHIHSSSDVCDNQESADTKKMVYVSVIGMPNSGKSTLVNKVLERRVVSVSKKVHTTRRETVAVSNVGNTQMVFLDNPGFVTKAQAKKYETEASLYKDPLSSVKKADVVVLIHDVADIHYKHNLAPSVVQALQLRNPTSSTVIAFNKVDRIRQKTELLDIVRALSKSYGFQLNQSSSAKKMTENYLRYTNNKVCQKTDDLQFEEVFMLSALTGDGVEELKRFILSRAKPSPWKYEEGYFTDQSLNELVVMCVREKILDVISEEIPYKVTPVVDSCVQNPYGYIISVQLPCNKKRFASALMGREGKTIKTIALITEQALSEALQCLVTVRLSITMSSSKKK